MLNSTVFTSTSIALHFLDLSYIRRLSFACHPPLIRSRHFDSVCPFLLSPLRDSLLSTTFDCLSFNTFILHPIMTCLLVLLMPRCITRNIGTSKEIQ
ncbi:hypothetical protein IW262DRAFT_1495024, partial [Armillaria fumosa]